MFSFLSLPKCLAIFCTTPALAAYTIDDTNSTIQYIPNGVGGLQWHAALIPEINLTASYNNTTTVGECNASQNCHLRIPFIGSGITIYVVQVNFAGINVSVTVDSQPPAICTFPEPEYYQHNFSLFDIQELPLGNHIIDVALLDCQYNASNRFAYTNGTSGLAFDSAVINDQQISPPLPTSSGGSRAVKYTPIIVGGVIGGLVVLATIVLLLLYFRRHKHSRNRDLVHHRTEIEPYMGFAQVPPLEQSTVYAPANDQRPSRSTLPYVHPTAFNADNLYGPASTLSAAQFAHDSTNHGIPISSALVPSITAPDPSDHISAFSSIADPSEGRHLSPASTSQLTGAQIDFVHNLYRLNVPAAEVAAVMERMRVEREPSGAIARMGLGRRDTMASEPLPSYDS